MTCKTLDFTKFINKTGFFIPLSFDKFFEAGKFEGKTYSVNWIGNRMRFFVYSKPEEIFKNYTNMI